MENDRTEDHRNEINDTKLKGTVEGAIVENGIDSTKEGSKNDEADYTPPDSEDETYSTDSDVSQTGKSKEKENNVAKDQTDNNTDGKCNGQDRSSVPESELARPTSSNNSTKPSNGEDTEAGDRPSSVASGQSGDGKRPKSSDSQTSYSSISSDNSQHSKEQEIDGMISL